MKKQYYTYFLTNKNNTVLYIGVTNNLIRRVYEHKNKLIDGFTYRYNLDKLIHFELLDDPQTAIAREKQLKNWHKDWKWNLIKENNPSLKDLYDEMLK